MVSMEIISKSVSETGALAKDFVTKLHPGAGAKIVALYGDLGSGKTVFVKGAGAALGVSETVTSPTFVIEKIYKLKGQNFGHMIHIDAYRLESGKEMTSLGWKEISENPDNLIFIEWPEMIADILPEDLDKIYFEFAGENERKIKF